MTFRVQKESSPSGWMFVLSYALVCLLVVLTYAIGAFGQLTQAIGFKSYPDIYAFIVILFLGILVTFLARKEAGSVMGLGTIASFFVLTINQEPLIRYLTLA